MSKSHNFNQTANSAGEDFPTYHSFASHLLAQPQDYGLDGAVGGWPTHYEVYDPREMSLRRWNIGLSPKLVRNVMPDSIERKLVELAAEADELNALYRQKETLRRNGSMRGQGPRPRLYDQLSMDEVTQTRPRRSQFNPRRLSFANTSFHTLPHPSFANRSHTFHTLPSAVSPRSTGRSMSRSPIAVLDEIIHPEEIGMNRSVRVPSWRRRLERIPSTLLPKFLTRRRLARKIRPLEVPPTANPIDRMLWEKMENERILNLVANSSPRTRAKLMKMLE